MLTISYQYLYNNPYFCMYIINNLVLIATCVCAKYISIFTQDLTFFCMSFTSFICSYMDYNFVTENP